MSEVKELDFFTAEDNWGRGVEWYERQFPGAEGARAVGEASPRYTMDGVLADGVARRMASVLPDAKLIYLVRHPIERMRSAWVQNYTERAWEFEPITAALLNKPYYTLTSSYARQLAPYLEVYGRDQLLVVTAEELASSTRGDALCRICRFIGVSEDWQPPAADAVDHNPWQSKVVQPRWSVKLQSSPVRRLLGLAPAGLRARYWKITQRPAQDLDRTITPDVTSQLVERLAPDLVRLRQIMGPDFGAWGLLDGT